MKRALFLILLFAPLLAEGVRPQRDRIGFSTTPEQLSQVIALSQKRSPTLLAEMERKTAGKTPFVALSPHDDHLLAGEFYLSPPPLDRHGTSSASIEVPRAWTTRTSSRRLRRLESAERSLSIFP